MERLINHGLDANTYIVIPPNSECIFIVDPGISTENFISKIEKYNFKKIVVLITHHHFDHIYGLPFLFNYYGKNSLEVIANTFCVNGMRSSKLNLSLYSKFSPVNYDESISIYDEDCEILIDGTVITIFQTPGHTLSSLSYRIGNHIFAGDLMIPGFKTVTNLPTGNKLLAIKSINSLLCSNDLNHCIICPGHGDYFNVSEVKLEDFIRV
jgi:glyoxylase-like metal-dependent hydrolase (beta-lactamase superfamily II)